MNIEPKYSRIARQNVAAGYRLCIERPQQKAEWRKHGSNPRGIPFEMAMRIAREMEDEIGEDIIRVGIGSLKAVPLNKPLIEPEPIMVTLKKQDYTVGQLAEVTGLNANQIVYGRTKGQIDAVQPGDNTSPYIFPVNDKLVQWLKSKGVKATIETAEGDGSAEAVESPETDAAPSVTDGKGRIDFDGDAYSVDASEAEDEWADWQPTPKNIEELPEPVRELVDDLKAQRDEAKNDVRNYVQECEQLRNSLHLKDEELVAKRRELKERGDALEEMHEKYDALEKHIIDLCDDDEIKDAIVAIGYLEEWLVELQEDSKERDRIEAHIHDVCEDRIDVIHGETPERRVTVLAHQLDAARKQNEDLHQDLSKAQVDLEHLSKRWHELERVIIERFDQRYGSITYSNPVQALQAIFEQADRDVINAHEKGLADAEFNARVESNGKPFSIRKLLERASMHVVNDMIGRKPEPSRVPVVDAADAIARTRKVLRFMLRAIYHDIETSGGSDAIDGMAYVILGELEQLERAKDGLQGYLNEHKERIAA